MTKHSQTYQGRKASWEARNPGGDYAAFVRENKKKSPELTIPQKTAIEVAIARGEPAILVKCGLHISRLREYERRFLRLYA